MEPNQCSAHRSAPNTFSTYNCSLFQNSCNSTFDSKQQNLPRRRPSYVPPERHEVSAKELVKCLLCFYSKLNFSQIGCAVPGSSECSAKKSARSLFPSMAAPIGKWSIFVNIFNLQHFDRLLVRNDRILCFSQFSINKIQLTRKKNELLTCCFLI